MSQTANNNQNNTNNTPQPPANPFGSRPSTPPAPTSPSGGSRFGQSQSNTNSTPPSSGGSLFGRARTPQPALPPNHREWTIQPACKTVVRFDLAGLGDPFMRLLGAEPNAEYANLDTLTQTLERGGEQVDALRAQLMSLWEKSNLQGAALVWRYDASEWKTICFPPLPQTDQNDDETNDSPPARKPLFRTLRALDSAFVMNVLARSRSQLMIASTPLTFDAEFLCATLMSDDPRLVRLALATGCLEE